MPKKKEKSKREKLSDEKTLELLCSKYKIGSKDILAIKDEGEEICVITVHSQILRRSKYEAPTD